MGAIVVPNNGELYCTAEVLAVGRGNALTATGVTETSDLKPGQLVWVKYKDVRQGQGGYVKFEAGIRYEHDGDKCFIFEQNSVLGIIAQPGEWTAPTPLPAPAAKSLRLVDASGDTIKN